MRYILLLSIICSCYSPSKQLNKAFAKAPDKVAEFSREKFPCAESGIDTVINTEYDFIEIKCPDTIDDSHIVDTVFINKLKPEKTYIYKNQFLGVPTTSKTIIKTVRDSACEVVLAKNINENKRLEMRLEKDSDWLKWLLIMLAISIILNIILIIKK